MHVYERDVRYMNNSTASVLNNTPTAATMHAFLKRASVRAVYDRFHSLQMFCIQRISRGASPPISSCASALTFLLDFMVLEALDEEDGNNMTHGWTNLHFRIRGRRSV